MSDRNNTENSDLMFLLHKCSHFLHHKGGKRGQFRILKILAGYPEISQKELQDQLGIEPGSMSELVIKLEHKGLITRRKDETDKRMTKLLITDLGLELSKEIEVRASEEDQLVAELLTAEEQEQLKGLLLKLLKGWEETYGTQMMHRCHEGKEHGHGLKKHMKHMEAHSKSEYHSEDEKEHHHEHHRKDGKENNHDHHREDGKEHNQEHHSEEEKERNHDHHREDGKERNHEHHREDRKE